MSMNSGRRGLTTITAVAAVVIFLAGLVTAVLRQSAEPSEAWVARVGPTTTSTEPAPTTTAPPATVPAASDEPPAIREIREQVAQIRGLPWKAPLKVAVLPSAQFLVELRRVIERDRNPAREAAEGETLKLLHVIPQDLDYSKTLEDLYSGAVIGFYDTITKELFVRDQGGGGLGPQARMTLAHELDHALTDQHFDFGSKIDALDDAGRLEEVTGFLGLVEGDARLVDNLWAGKYLSEDEQIEALLGGVDDGGSVTEVPPFLRDMLQFPYDDGRKFVEHLVDTGGFAKVDEVYKRPPTSTEQILHPELYTAGQGWTPPPLPDIAAATGCTAVGRGTLGEFEMSEVLDEAISEGTADRATQGWNGDAYQLVRCGNAFGMVDRWQADDAAAAGRFADAVAEWAGNWSGSSVPSGDGRFVGPKGAGRLVQAGARVDLVLAADQATADRISAAL